MNKPLVLVVEDDTPVRNLITTTLKTHEYRYLSAQNGASAVMEAPGIFGLKYHLNKFKGGIINADWFMDRL